MSYCLNPQCQNPTDPLNAHTSYCRHCGTEVLIKQRFRILRLLGEGGFAKTFEINDRGTLKVLKLLIDNNTKAIALFKREFEVLSRLKHPGIPQVEKDGYFTVFPRNGQQPLHCLVMEKIDGPNVEEWMFERGHQPIPQNQAIAWLRQLTAILHQVHRQQYFHRDIKPSNIMLRPNKQLVLIDFGTVREVTGTYLAKVGGGHKMTGIISPGYTPPEQANGKAVPQSDFFALGRTFVYLLTGRDPNEFPEDPRTGQLKWRESARQISPDLADLVDYLMAPFPGNRPQNTQVIIDCLGELERPVYRPQTSAPSLQFAYPAGSLPIQVAPSRSRRLGRSSRKKRYYGFSRRTRHRNLKIGYPLLAGGVLLLMVGMSPQIQDYFDQLPAAPIRFQSLKQVAFPGTAAIADPAQLQNVRHSHPPALNNPALKNTLSGHIYGVNSVAISPDGKTIASGSIDKQIKIWDLTTGKLIRTLSGHDREIWSVSISPDGKLLASSSGDKTIKVWNLQTGELLKTLSGHLDRAIAVVFSPDAKLLASSSLDNTIRIWETQTGKAIRTLAGHSSTVSAIAFSPNGQTLASGSFDHTIKLWQVSTGQALKTLAGHSSRVLTVAYSPDGTTLVSGSGDGSIKFWQVSTGQLARSLSGHSDRVSALAISSDGQLLVTSGGPLDSTIKVWRLTNGQLLHTFVGHTDTVYSVAITPDGKMLASGSEDYTIKLWQLR